MITLTEVAGQQVCEIIKQQLDAAKEKNESPDKLCLRVGVRGGGCGGFGYSLDIAEEIGEQDEAWEQHGVTLVCDSRSHIYLDGTTIDFKDEEMGRGFVFNNPNSTNTCGCGSAAQH
jgi:iron-sulfur cluster assembly protein